MIKIREVVNGYELIQSNDEDYNREGYASNIEVFQSFAELVHRLKELCIYRRTTHFILDTDK